LSILTTMIKESTHSHSLIQNEQNTAQQSTFVYWTQPFLIYVRASYIKRRRREVSDSKDCCGPINPKFKSRKDGKD